MRLLLDTSVIVAALVEPHPMHERALAWLKRAKAKENEFIIASHTLAELYAVLTTLPVTPRISSGIAWRLIHENIETSAKVVSLSASEYSTVIKHLSDQGIHGGIVYDALIAQVAKKSDVERLLTLNPDDFNRIWPEGSSIVTVP